MSNKFTTATKISVMSSMVIFVPLLLGGIGAYMFQTLNKQMETLAHVSVPAVRNMTLVDMMHDGIRANVLNALRVADSNDEKEIKEVLDESKEFADNMQKWLGELGALELSANSAALVAGAKPEVETYGKLGIDLVTLALTGKKSEAEAGLPKFMEQFGVLETKLGDLGDKIETEAKDQAQMSGITARHLSIQGATVILISFAVGTFFSLLTMRDLKQSLRSIISRLSHEAVQFSQSAMILSASSDKLNEASEQQSGAITSTASAIDEIEAMLAKTNENGEILGKTSQASSETAARGHAAMTQMSEAIDAIRIANEKLMSEIENSNTKIAEITHVISEIGAKTRVINDIVFQTKLLSFNASVEAARAGEHGRGFSVVAEEVGNLAAMSGNAAKEIQTMLDTSISRVSQILDENRRNTVALTEEAKRRLSQGNDVAERCRQTLEEIVRQSKQVNTTVIDIATAIRDQRGGVTEIAQAVHRLTSANSTNVESAVNTQQQASSLKSQAEGLNDLVTELTTTLLGAKDTSVLDQHNEKAA